MAGGPCRHLRAPARLAATRRIGRPRRAGGRRRAQGHDPGAGPRERSDQEPTAPTAPADAQSHVVVVAGDPGTVVGTAPRTTRSGPSRRFWRRPNRCPSPRPGPGPTLRSSPTRLRSPSRAWSSRSGWCRRSASPNPDRPMTRSTARARRSPSFARQRRARASSTPARSRSRTAPSQVLVDVDLRVAEGEAVALVAPSGVSRSALLRVLAGVGPPSSGQVLLDGEDVSVPPVFPRPPLDLAEIVRGRPLLGSMTVAENLRMYGFTVGHDKAEVDASTAVAFEVFPQLTERRDAGVDPVRRRPSASRPGPLDHGEAPGAAGRAGVLVAATRRRRRAGGGALAAARRRHRPPAGGGVLRRPAAARWTGPTCSPAAAWPSSRCRPPRTRWADPHGVRRPVHPSGSRRPCSPEREWGAPAGLRASPRRPRARPGRARW